jgi:hypothetical protein
MENSSPVSRYFCPRWGFALIIILLSTCPASAGLFSGDYVYTLNRNKIVRTLGSKPVSFLPPGNNNSDSRRPYEQNASDPSFSQSGKRSNNDRNQPTISERMNEQFRQMRDQADQIVADSFTKHNEPAYTPEFVDRTLIHANQAMIRETQTTAARVQNRLSQLQNSTSPTAASERAALQEQLTLLRARETQLQGEQNLIR